VPPFASTVPVPGKVTRRAAVTLQNSHKNGGPSMLSHEAQELTTLILARHILIAQAAEASATFEYLTALHEPPFDRLRPSTDDEETIHRRFREVAAELHLFPALLDALEGRIDDAWEGLQGVTPDSPR
jgi:hypothetical protein